MKTKEFNLSEKIKELFEIEYLDSMADVQGDVSKIIKEFIQKLKELQGEWTEEMNKLAGDELT